MVAPLILGYPTSLFIVPTKFILTLATGIILGFNFACILVSTKHGPMSSSADHLPVSNLVPKLYMRMKMEFSNQNPNHLANSFIISLLIVMVQFINTFLYCNNHLSVVTLHLNALLFTS